LWLPGCCCPNRHPPCDTETGTICSLVYDIPNKRISTLLAFSKGIIISLVPFLIPLLMIIFFSGHWEQPTAAHGNKRNAADFERWRELAKIGIQTDRYLLSEQANILEVFRGKGNLEAIGEDWPRR
jgi:hypothetical protein